MKLNNYEMLEAVCAVDVCKIADLLERQFPNRGLAAAALSDKPSIVYTLPGQEYVYLSIAGRKYSKQHRWHNRFYWSPTHGFYEADEIVDIKRYVPILRILSSGG